MSWNKRDAAEKMRQRLQSDLRSAMKARTAREVAVLRQLIAAIDNAGAVSLPAKTEPIQCEVKPRALGPDDIQALLQREFDLRRHAADEFASLGRTVEARKSEIRNGCRSALFRYAPKMRLRDAEQYGGGRRRRFSSSSARAAWPWRVPAPSSPSNSTRRRKD